MATDKIIRNSLGSPRLLAFKGGGSAGQGLCLVLLAFGEPYKAGP